jgi:hypothetical protein
LVPSTKVLVGRLQQLLTFLISPCVRQNDRDAARKPTRHETNGMRGGALNGATPHQYGEVIQPNPHTGYASNV